MRRRPVRALPEPWTSEPVLAPAAYTLRPQLCVNESEHGMRHLWLRMCRYVMLQAGVQMVLPACAHTTGLGGFPISLQLNSRPCMVAGAARRGGEKRKRRAGGGFDDRASDDSDFDDLRARGSRPGGAAGATSAKSVCFAGLVLCVVVVVGCGCGRNIGFIIPTQAHETRCKLWVVSREGETRPRLSAGLHSVLRQERRLL